ncbi:MAG: hypothetical protein HOK21_23630 [Rhodospirillaceae bacterium]|jgi:hypothetical protein|nr:hypothetical protein [Rhodospirillaceae bacterium]MBT4042266.1 hypothetical protein [Rhodospirillaceae bacterium]MBT4687508.1 hypothetical protein [Rhodospirillaceae bacterium]MBT5080210.1 hypothetical protein [Rhodospirillaceae bacterium]MBT5527091.1 hypothetical protein [Rhodospirillaceae bacterium]
MAEWCRCGVAGEIAWPRKQAIVEFGNWELLAFPSTRDHEPSLHIELTRNKVSAVGARTIFNRLLSICSWCDDAPAALLDGDCGGPDAYPLARTRRSGHLTSIIDAWPYHRAPLAHPDQRLAVALYREAVWLEYISSIPYAALGYFKILEIRQGGAGRKTWLDHHLQQAMELGEIDDFYLEKFVSAAGENGLSPARYLYENCRLAVAHAAKAPVVDPDDAQSVRDLSASTQVLRTLARKYICVDLDVLEDHWQG